MTAKRLHIEELAQKDERITAAFAMICAVLDATSSNDLEADIQFGDKQYHFDVSLVAKNE